MKVIIKKALFIIIALIYSNALFAIVKVSVISGMYSDNSIWSPAGVPSATDSVVIMPGHTVTLASNTTVGSINIQSGAVFDNSTFRLTMGTWGPTVAHYVNNGIHNGTGNIYYGFNGNSGFTGSGVTNCNIEIESEGPQFLNSCNITINGNIFTVVNGFSTGKFTINNYGFITLNGDITANLPAGGNSTPTHLRNYAGASIIQTGNINFIGLITNSGTFTVSGTVHLLPSNVTNNPYTIVNNYDTFTITGDLLGSGALETYFLQGINAYAKFSGQVFPVGNDGGLGAYRATNHPNTIEYDGGINQIVKTPSVAYFFLYSANNYSNLIVSNNNIKSLSSNTVINGDLTITGNAQLDVTSTSYNIDIKGNWINTGVNANPFIEQTGKVTFSGSNAQTITANLGGGETYNNLTMKNTSTGVTQANNNINVSNTLTLTDGLLHTGIYETYVTSNLSSSILQHSTDSYVNGYLRRSIISTGGIYDFPVGNSTSYQLASLDIDGGHTVNNLIANFANLVTGSGFPLSESGNNYTQLLNNGGVSPGVGNVNGGVWTITPDIGTADYALTLSGRNHDNQNTAATIVKRVDSSSPWQILGVYTSTSGVEPLIASRNSYSGFSQFAIGIDAITLAIDDITNFNVKCNYLENEAILNWGQKQQNDEDEVIIEKSINKIEWDEIATVYKNESGVYEYFDYLNKGENGYYRLAEKISSEQIKYSKIKGCSYDKSGNININLYPNPSSDYINLSIYSLDDELIKYEIINYLGEIIESNSIETQSKNKIDISSFSKGLYVLRVEYKERVYNKFFNKL